MPSLGAPAKIRRDSADTADALQERSKAETLKTQTTGIRVVTPALAGLSGESPGAPPLSWWARKSWLALVDQALFTGTNLLVSTVLARWLEPEYYGAFAVAFAVMLLFAAFYSAVLIEPMLVFGAGRYDGKFGPYLGILIRIHLWLASAIAALCLGVALIAFAMRSEALAPAFAAMALAAPFILLSWLSREACYVRAQLGLTVVAGLIRSAVVVAGLGGLYWAHLVSPASAFGLIGLGEAVGGVLVLKRLRPKWKSPGHFVNMATVLADHWAFGAWNTVATALWWFSGQVLFLLVPPFLGLESVAVLAALMNLLRPLNPLMRVFNSLFLTLAARLLAKAPSCAELRRFAFLMLLVAVGGTLCYGLGLSLISRPILHHLYKGRYDAYHGLVALLALVYAASAVQQVFGIILKASGKLRSLAFAWSASPFVTAAAAIPALLSGSLAGVLLAMLCGNLVGACLSWRACKGSLDAFIERRLAGARL